MTCNPKLIQMGTCQGIYKIIYVRIRNIMEDFGISSIFSKYCSNESWSMYGIVVRIMDHLVKTLTLSAMLHFASCQYSAKSVSLEKQLVVNILSFQEKKIDPLTGHPSGLLQPCATRPASNLGSTKACRMFLGRTKMLPKSASLASCAAKSVVKWRPSQNTCPPGSSHTVANGEPQRCS